MTGPIEEFRFPTAIIRKGEHRYSLRVDRIAANHHGRIYMIGVIGDASAIRGMGAVLGGKGDRAIAMTGLQVTDGQVQTALYTCTRIEEGYRRHVHRLGLGMAHAVFVGRDPRFLPNSHHEALWHVLMGTRYTTPMLRDWVPEIVGRLKAEGLLRPTMNFRCRCGLLTAKPEQLDQIVAAAVRSRSVAFREGA